LLLEIQSQALLTMAGGRELQLFDTPALEALSTFKATSADVVANFPFDDETRSFAGSLSSKLQRLGWKPTDTGDTPIDRSLQPVTGINISTRRISREHPFDCGSPPYVTVDQKTCLAGDALTEYLTSVGIAADHDGAPPALVPSGQVHIGIGPRANNIDPQLLANLEETLRKLPQR
jgi:hypothetical protein